MGKLPWSILPRKFLPEDFKAAQSSGEWPGSRRTFCLFWAPAVALMVDAEARWAEFGAGNNVEEEVVFVRGGGVSDDAEGCGGARDDDLDKGGASDDDGEAGRFR